VLEELHAFMDILHAFVTVDRQPGFFTSPNMKQQHNRRRKSRQLKAKYDQIHRSASLNLSMIRQQERAALVQIARDGNVRGERFRWVEINGRWMRIWTL
jgi:hypothetical protein